MPKGKLYIWRDLPLNNHTWSFYYFCKRAGDFVIMQMKGDKCDIYLRKKEGNRENEHNS